MEEFPEGIERLESRPTRSNPPSRPLEEHLRLGCVVLDKPRGPSSHQVVSWLKLALGLSKAGHGGTLDPQVTGVLPVALGDSTRVISTLLEAPKEYVALLETHSDVSKEALERALREFEGPIYQTPPMKSAVKKELRIRRIYRIEILEVEPRRALFRVLTEAGTYVRKLCHDVGYVLGVGTSMRDLRRTRTGPFREEESVTLHDVRDSFEHWKETGDESELRRVVRPVEDLVSHLPRIVVRDSAVDALCHGAPLHAPGVVEVEPNLRKGGLAAAFTLKGELVAVGRATLDSLEARKARSGVVLKTDRVVMKEGTYPRMWRSKSLRVVGGNNTEGGA